MQPSAARGKTAECVALRSSVPSSPDESYVARPSENATWGKSGRQWGEMMAVVGENRGRRRPSAVSQAVLMVQWLWSLSRLCVAVTNRHSDKAADRPLRMKRSMCRLYLIWPNTGSIVIFRWA